MHISEVGARDNFRDNATMSRSRKIVALSLIIRKLSRCRCREENLSLIFTTLSHQTHKLTTFMCCAVGCVQGVLISLRSETQRNRNSFASFPFSFAKPQKKFRFISLKKAFRFGSFAKKKVLLQNFRFRNSFALKMLF